MHSIDDISFGGKAGLSFSLTLAYVQGLSRKMSGWFVVHITPLPLYLPSF